MNTVVLTMRSIFCGLLFVLLTPICTAEIFVYLDQSGHRIISDHPLPGNGYRLLTTKKTLRNLGKILANRPPECTGSSSCFRESIDFASKRYKIDPDLVEAIIQTESGFNPSAMSIKGATGLMQLMDATADDYSVDDSMSPDENILAGVRHLSMLMQKFNNHLPTVLAAYNSGAGIVERSEGIPPYPETQRFVTKVLTHYERIKAQQTSVAASSK